MVEIPLVLKCPRNNQQSTKENCDQGQQRLKKKKSVAVSKKVLAVEFCGIEFFNPLIPTSDRDRISPHNIGIIPSGQVMRITKNIN